MRVRWSPPVAGAGGCSSACSIAPSVRTGKHTPPRSGGFGCGGGPGNTHHHAEAVLVAVGDRGTHTTTQWRFRLRWGTREHTPPRSGGFGCGGGPGNTHGAAVAAATAHMCDGGSDGVMTSGFRV
eukprot:47747-Chlamydomonas_euryale.AAC.9